MALVQLTDVIVPSVFAPYVQNRTTELSELWQSGIVQTDPQVTALAQGGGKTYNMPFFNDLTSSESNVGSDNPASLSVPDKITAGQDISVKHVRNKSWSSANLVSAFIGPDPMNNIVNLVANYWARDMQNSLISSLQGVIADNIANDSSDMVTVIGNDAAGAVTDAERISADAVLTAKQTMGDAAGNLVAMAMHSAIYTRLQRQNLITFIPNARGEVNIPTYLGYRIIVDDNCPAVAGTNRILYTVYLFGAGAVAFGEGSPRIPVEVDRDPDQGDGEGVETLYSRRHFILHPRGIAFQNASVAGQSPTNAELEAAANWSRVYDRKLVRFAALQVND